LFNSPQITIVPKDLKLKSNMYMGGREGEGVGEEREGVSRFSLSRPVNPKHNPCTCRLMLRCCPAMTRESKFWLWIHKPKYNGTMELRLLDLSLGQFRRALKTHLFWRSLWRLVIYFSALTKFSYLLTLQKKQLKQYITSCKTVADTLKITVLNTKTSSAAGRLRPADPPPGALPPGPPLGAPSPDPIIGSHSRARHGRERERILFATALQAYQKGYEPI